jgi:hypothetical protein
MHDVLQINSAEPRASPCALPARKRSANAYLDTLVQRTTGAHVSFVQLPTPGCKACGPLGRPAAEAPQSEQSRFDLLDETVQQEG